MKRTIEPFKNGARNLERGTVFRLLTLTFILNFQLIHGQPIKSEIRSTDDGYRIFVDGAPFFVKGAGVDQGDIKALADHGANALRTWSMDNAEMVLDQAHQLGLKVMMGIWVGLERHGFDYDDKKAVRLQLKRIEKRVKELKDHPALLLWGIGNEMNLQSTNPKVWDAVNDIAKTIRKVDPYHLTTTSLAGIDKKDVGLVVSRAPEVDFLSVQLYGPMDILPQLIENSGYKGPLLVTEWGATGYWEVEKTTWGAPLENHSSKKAALYLSRYQRSILGNPKQIMGSFVFLWGQKQERTPTWFGMFMPDGTETESVDVMHFVWNGTWPVNRSPKVLDFTLDGKRADANIVLKPGQSYPSQISVADPEKDSLAYRWEIMEESRSTKSGGDKEYIPKILPSRFDNGAESKTTFYSPNNEGSYRLFIYVMDGHAHTAHANIPFKVQK